MEGKLCEGSRSDEREGPCTSVEVISPLAATYKLTSNFTVGPCACIYTCKLTQ